jgi:hypothetical protein
MHLTRSQVKTPYLIVDVHNPFAKGRGKVKEKARERAEEKAREIHEVISL